MLRNIWHAPRMRNRAQTSVHASDTDHRSRAPISLSLSASIEGAGVRKGSNWASERAARVDSGVLMGQDQGADGAGSGEELYQEQLRAQGAGSSRARAAQHLQQAAQVKAETGQKSGRTHGQERFQTPSPFIRCGFLA